MAHDEDHASNAGRFVGILSALLLVAALFGGYWMLTSGPNTQSNATSTQQTPAITPSPDSTKATPPASETPPQKNLPRDGESTSQNAN